MKSSIINKLENNFFTIILFLVSTILIINIFGYFHELGYDGEHHKWYIEVMPLSLPTDQDTKEYFSPPLPYLFPSIIDSGCDKFNEIYSSNFDCTYIYGKLTQILQALMLIGIIFLIRDISQTIEPKNKEYLNSVLLLFIIIPVSYKSFAMIRGEPYISFFMFVLIAVVTKVTYKKVEITNKLTFFTGTILGFIGLSRQWGLLFFPALFVLWLIVIKKNNLNFSIKFTRYAFFSFLISLFVFSWFYILLFLDYGSITAFNRNPVSFNFSNQPSSFYFGLGLEDIFSKPIRGFSMTNMLIPVLYSDVWGDYWGYFTVTMGRGGLSPNYEIVKYLGRVNLVSIIPTMIMLFGIIRFILKLKTNYKNKLFYTFIFSAISFFGIGYMWFLIKYPIPLKGDTIKGTYILPLVHLLPFFGAFLLDKIKELSATTYNVIFGILVLIMIHNTPAMVTRFFGGM